MANKTCKDLLALFQDNVGDAAVQLDVSRQTIYNWKKKRHLPDTAMRTVREWFLSSKKAVPADWMP